MAVAKPRPAVLRQTEAVVAAINPSLRALTAAALALPGLTPAITQAATPGENEAQLQYGVYEESDREVVENSKIYDPMHIETLQGAVKGRLTDRVTFGFNYIQDTWSGATPITTAPIGAMNPVPELSSGASTYVTEQVLVDDEHNTYSHEPDVTSGLYTKVPGTVHMMTSASPETRKQGTVNFTYEFEDAAIDFGGGASSETDYYSRYLNFGGRKDFNQKLTTLSLGFSRTDSDIETVLPSRFDSYIDDSAYVDQIETKTIAGSSARVLHGERNDWSMRLGLSQVLSKNSVIETGIGFTRATGFQENPYKAVLMIFVDPEQEPDPQGLLVGETSPVMEKRPDTRDQMTWSTRFMHYFANLDAATHLEYRYYRDDWGLRSHTMEGDWAQAAGNGWTITPRLRYYSQNAAEFYQSYFIFDQATPTYPGTIDPDTGAEIPGAFNINDVSVANYSSDHRLSAYGTLSRGITVSKQFTKGVNLDVGFEYYTHRGAGRMGTGGEGEYADFDSYSLNAAVRVDFAAAGAMIDSGSAAGADADAHTGHGEHQAHSGHAAAPAGVMFDHMLTKRGDYMIGYRYMFHRQAGNMIRGSEPTDDLRVVANACGDINCSMTASEHTMHMHMLDFMYAPRDWLNVMIMPQFVDMTMEMRELEGAPEEEGGGHQHGGGNEHATGGLGDTTLAALIKIGDYGKHHFHATLGMSLPTGDVQQKSEVEVNVPTDVDSSNMDGVDQFVDYGMQLGSGTLDFIMGLTYTGQATRWSWGGQLSTTQRFNDIGNLSDTNESGYALGDIFQITGWGGYNITPSVSATLRGVYTSQDSIDGSYNAPHTEMTPMDYPQNYGGQFYDIGVGLSASPKSGSFKGNRFGIEWLETVKELPKGFQLERAGQLAATWTIPL